MYYQPRLSPDGRQLAITVAGGNDDIWIHDFDTGVLGRFTISGPNYLFPSWTPDGNGLVFFRSDTRELLWQRVDRATSPEVLAAADQMVPHSWSPDGQQLVVTEPGEGGGADIRVLRVADGQRRPLVATRFTEVAPGVSPDGRWLAYTSDESGRFEVYVVPFPDGGARIQISRDGGTEPVWAKEEGGELFFRQDQRLMAVATTPRFGTPIALFDAEWWVTRFSARPNYDVARDAHQFVLLKSSQRADSARIHVIVKWAAGPK
jgi:serine/threonine-protein kinase